jgi:hypothetical protein
MANSSLQRFHNERSSCYISNISLRLIVTLLKHLPQHQLKTWSIYLQPGFLYKTNRDHAQGILATAQDWLSVGLRHHQATRRSKKWRIQCRRVPSEEQKDR